MQLVEDATEDWRRNRRAVGRSLEDQGAAAISTISEGERVHKTHTARNSNVSSSNFERHGLTGSERQGLTRSASHPQADSRVAIGSSAIRRLAPMEAVQASAQASGCELLEQEEGDIPACTPHAPHQTHQTHATPRGRPGPHAPLIELLRYSLTQHTSPHQLPSGD
jgi:hypothetical protein